MMHNFYIGRGKKLGHCLKIKPYPFKLWSNHSLKNIVFLTSTISSNGLRISFFFSFADLIDTKSVTFSTLSIE
jgi:hypothetical protein